MAATFAGFSVLVDRDSGAQRELLAAPVPRALLVLGNLTVVLALCAFQVIALIGVAALRGADFHVTASGIAWFTGATMLFTVLMYGVAETLASRVPRQEEYIAATPAIAPAACRGRRSTSPRHRRSRSCRGSSPARCSPSRRCRRR